MQSRLIDPMTLYVIVGGALVILVGLALRQVESLQKGVPLWLWTGLAGLLFGGIAVAFAVHHMRPKPAWEITAGPAAGQVARPPAGMPGMAGAPGTGAGMRGNRAPGTGAGMSAMAGMGSMSGMGGGAATTREGPGTGPRARRDLPVLVGKLELLTRGLHLKLDAEQIAKLMSAVEALDKDEEMSEESARAHLDAIKQILTSEISELLALIELPRGGSGGGSAAPVAQESNENPFKDEIHATRLHRLREQLDGMP